MCGKPVKEQPFEKLGKEWEGNITMNRSSSSGFCTTTNFVTGEVEPWTILRDCYLVGPIQILQHYKLQLGIQFMYRPCEHNNLRIDVCSVK
jgi:hypothetical protein